MKRLWLLCLLLVAWAGVASAQQQITLQDSIVGNVHLTADKTYLIKGFVYVVDGATLTIDKGTVLFGDKASKGTLIVERGGKLIAVGTPAQPIVFTSQVAPGSRGPGDWGGVVLCGRAPINQDNTLNGGTHDGGDNQIEGGPRTHYGGTNEHDNSGHLSYVRIEFPGVALSPNNEINGLTFGGVGDSTIIDHVQVSYSGDDSYEWFGGSVRCKYMIGFRGWDDDWDTDFGFHGAVQFGLSKRDPQIADVSLSNGFESDNDASGHFYNPRTSAKFVNMTVVGPMADTSQSTSINPLFGRMMHLRRSTQLSIYNSIVMGWPNGLLIDGAGTAASASGDSLQIRNTILACLRPGHDFLMAGLPGGDTFNTENWFKKTSYNNKWYTQPSSLMLKDAFNLTAPDFTPLSSSPAANAADFTNPRLANDPWFTQTSYVGAFDPNGQRWDMGWTNYTPQTTTYQGVATAATATLQFPNTAVGTYKDTTITLIQNTGTGPIFVTNWWITDTTAFKAINLPSSFAVPVGSSYAVTLRFIASDTSSKTQAINFQFDNSLSQIAVTLKGKGTQALPAVSLYPSSTALNFAYTRLNTTATIPVIVTNSGTADLVISSAAVSGTDAAQFSVSGGSNVTVTPGQKTTINVSFTPTSLGAKSAQLRINHNAAGGSTMLNLTGAGINVPTSDVLSGDVTGNITLTNDRIWILSGYVYVTDGATLNIEPGTVIMGEKSTKGALIVERGGKLNAAGTAEHPIVFTSQEPAGKRDRGDWGGIILCGKAPINQDNTLNGGTHDGGDAQIEGGPRSHYGGTDEHDNSGTLTYVRIEFPGVAFSPNNEINGLTLGGVGDGTVIDHVQVSYSGDDNYEWFGGSVTAKHLIGFRGLDDDWDTDFGFHGGVQFGVSLRDPQVADISLSNGFESDNDAAGHFWNPRTSAKFINMTVVGPMSDTTQSGSINPLFGRDMHLRRSTQLSIYNSIVMGWPNGVLIDGAGTAASANGDSLQIHNTILANLRQGHDFLTASLGGVVFDTKAWFTAANSHNQTITQPAGVMLKDAFNLNAPDFTPQTGSPAIGAADFTNARLQASWISSTTYLGAFDPNGPRWDAGWSNYTPQQTVYAPSQSFSKNSISFGNIMVSKSAVDSVVITNNGAAPLTFSGVALTGSTSLTMTGASGGFTVAQGESKTLYVTFAPTAEGPASGTLTLTNRDESKTVIQINGTGTAAGVASAEMRAAINLRNTPNPFAGTTSIGYTVPNAGIVTLEIYNITGEKVGTLVNSFQNEGTYEATFDGRSLPRGVYYVKLEQNGVNVVHPISLVR